MKTFYILTKQVYNICVKSEMQEVIRVKKSTVINLFFTMLKIGLFTFGGGYAMLALLENEFIEKKKWIDRDEFVDMAAIAESTPGPIAINAATYIGYRMSGLIGAIASTVAVCIPSFAIIFVISLFFDEFLSLEYVAYAFRGIQVGVIYLILSAGIKIFKGMKRNFFNITVMLTVVVTMVLFSVFSVKFSAVFYILISGIAGITFYLIKELMQKKGGDSK